MRGVAISGGGKQPGLQHVGGERFNVRRRNQQREASHEFEPAFGHRRFTAGDFVEDDLRGEKFVLWAFQIPPIARELLVGGLNQISCGPGNDVARIVLSM